MSQGAKPTEILSPSHPQHSCVLATSDSGTSSGTLQQNDKIALHNLPDSLHIFCFLEELESLSVTGTSESILEEATAPRDITCSFLGYSSQLLTCPCYFDGFHQAWQSALLSLKFPDRWKHSDGMSYRELLIKPVNITKLPLKSVSLHDDHVIFSSCTMNVIGYFLLEWKKNSTKFYGGNNQNVYTPKRKETNTPETYTRTMSRLQVTMMKSNL